MHGYVYTYNLPTLIYVHMYTHVYTHTCLHTDTLTWIWESKESHTEEQFPSIQPLSLWVILRMRQGGQGPVDHCPMT